MVDIDLLLAWGATYKKLDPGEIIFKEGASCQFYMQLVSGSVKWFNIDEDGKEYIQTIIEAGECFGEIPLFDGGTYAATAIAESSTMIIRLSKSSFLQLIRDNPDIHFAFTKLLAKRVRFKFLLLKSLALQAPEARIATLLNYLKKEHKNFCPECNQLNLTRQQIADMTGLRVETVIRTIRSMHEKGVLTIDKGKVYC
ncbi:MAG: CarD family transcriptional regulator [Bacteroidetes bacterium 24-39-8]|jgi:CRP-like cAMP-binding protein|nr:MAG: CarD family transcriptional regulator [Sphingobacteriia bacterium 35-40-5]OYZ52567.1 MAG: CarD family transcriptional regulator [Bacteroidetes bacterium 24-39-8]HQS53626.1 Crp/Fnr family transcriptional regulator [Sediminibacterium sp.]